MKLAEIEPGKGLLQYTSEEGDTRVIWSPHNQDEIDNAKATFNRLKAKRFMAYTVDESGEQGEVMREFDPQAGRIIMTQPYAGG